MKDSIQFIKECVISAASDDYEEFQRILADVTGWAAERGLAVDSGVVLRGLEDAIAEGYVSAYVLSGTPPYSTPVKYSRAQAHDLWFYVTPTGKQLAIHLQGEWSADDSNNKL